MITALITFLSSSAGGALIGWIQSRMDQRNADRIRNEERLHQERMAARTESIAIYDKAIEASQIKPIRYVRMKSKTRSSHFLWVFRWGQPYETKTRIEIDRLSRTPRERTISVMVTAMIMTYCICCLWVGFFFMLDVSIIPPDSKQAGIDLLIFKLKFGGNKPVDQAVMGPWLYMLSPLIFISSNWIIRKNPNK